MNADEIIDFMSYADFGALGNEYSCNEGQCENCPLYTDNNTMGCAEFVIGQILSADWSGYNIEPEGVVSNGEKSREQIIEDRMYSKFAQYWDAHQVYNKETDAITSAALRAYVDAAATALGVNMLEILNRWNIRRHAENAFGKLDKEVKNGIR